MINDSSTKSSILMYSAGIEPVTLVMAELRSNRSASKTDRAYRKKANTYKLGGGGRNSRGRLFGFMTSSRCKLSAIDNKKFNFDVFGRNRTSDLSAAELRSN